MAHHPPERPLSRRRVWLLVTIGLALVLLVAVGFVAGALRKEGWAGEPGTPPIATEADDDHPRDQDTAGAKLPTVDREGYRRLPEGVADPAPLVERENPRSARYGVTTLIPACTLLTLADLKKHGLLLAPDVLGDAYQRSVFDGSGHGPVDRGSELFFQIQPPNFCQYLIRPKGLVKIEVFQETYTNPSAMVYEFKRYDDRPPIGEVSIRRATADRAAGGTTYSRYALRLGRTAVRLRMSLPSDAKARSLEQALLVTVAENLKRRSAHATGTSHITYDSPLLTSAPAAPCAVLRPDDFRALFRRPPAPFAEEGLGSAVGRIDFSIGTHISDASEYAYTTTRCKRFTGADSVDRHSLSVTVTGYTADAAAQHAMTVWRAMEGGKPLRRAEAYCVSTDQARAAGTLMIRQGRFVAALSMADPSRPRGSFDPMQRCEALLGVAARVANRLNASRH
ncbi:hypothetical protein HII36_14885 [Nonomuraea sp. NN258]|uniref:hypothetical protein n=1 Tax=Nonomuraea antri TaxID=2730852 RepID=UPI001568B2D6|nr:hypothetical protein [Nonomuraea antri]NRQ33118.1 hypothetical protein [Nonomuraea antri]